jgi:hypothetical protein
VRRIVFRSAVIDTPLQTRASYLDYFFFAFLTPDFLLLLDDFLTADFLDESLDFLADPEPPFLDFLDF